MPEWKLRPDEVSRALFLPRDLQRRYPRSAYFETKPGLEARAQRRPEQRWCLRERSHLLHRKEYTRNREAYDLWYVLEKNRRDCHEQRLISLPLDIYYLHRDI